MAGRNPWKTRWPRFNPLSATWSPSKESARPTWHRLLEGIPSGKSSCHSTSPLRTVTWKPGRERLSSGSTPATGRRTINRWTSQKLARFQRMFSRHYGTKHVAEVTNDDCREFVFREGTSPRDQINDRL